MAHMPAVTISEIAEAAGVSLATVSRVKNRSSKVSEEKRSRVYKVMEELGYRKRTPGEILREAERQIILIVCYGFYLMDDIYAGISEAAEKLDPRYQVLVVYTEHKTDGYRKALALAKTLPPHLLRGIIVYNNQCGDMELWAEFQKFPLVQICEFNNADPCFAVTTNDREAMKDLTRLLIRKGRRNFVFVTGEYTVIGEMFHFSQYRAEGFFAALREADIPFREDMMISVEHSLKGGSDAAVKIAGMNPRPDAVVCVVDAIAFGCFEELRHIGISIPGEIAITGFDDIAYSKALRPGLTTVRQSFDEIGAEAMRMLDALAGGTLRQGRITYVKHTVIERGSV
jgi:DNA-binding LacI/PurR family transcriptional regulator